MDTSIIISLIFGGVIASCAIFGAGYKVGGILSKKENKDLKKENSRLKKNIEKLNRENLNSRNDFEKSKTYTARLDKEIQELKRKHKEEIKAINGEDFPYGTLTNIKNTYQIYARSNFPDMVQISGQIKIISSPTTDKPTLFSCIINPAEKDFKIINQ